jgi:hypothetical protein
MTEHASKSKVAKLSIVLFAFLIVLFAFLAIGASTKSAETLWELLLGMAVAGAVIVLVLTLPASRARKVSEAIRAARPGSVVIETYWGDGYTSFFLKPGGTHRQTMGRGGRLLVVADRRGIELVRPRGILSFGLIPWNLVEDIQVQELSNALASRPKLVFEINGQTTPFRNRFELLSSGKDERANAGRSLNAILSQRPTSSS